MKNFIFYDDKGREDLLPLVFLKPCSELRVGILKIKEKWSCYFNELFSNYTLEYLNPSFPLNMDDDNVVINSRLIPNKKIVSQINILEHDTALFKGDVFVAGRFSRNVCESFFLGKIDCIKTKQFEEVTFLSRLWDIFTLNFKEIENDVLLLKDNESFQEKPKENVYYNADNVFVEKGAKIRGAIINAENGPVYIRKGSEIMEGALIRGPFALCENSVVKMGSKIYEGTTIGPYSKVGGEISNSVIQGYSNKAHDGFLGNSVLGEWCNLGADTNTSNLKNNYAEVRLWNYRIKRFEKTGLQFCGLIMGDHSKCGINTMFNTGTVVGVCSNIFGSGFPRNYIPSFSWGGPNSGFSEYKVEKVLDVCDAVFKRRNLELSIREKDVINFVFEITKNNRA